MNEHPITDLFKVSLTNLQDIIDVNTIVGERIDIGDNSYAIPIAKVKSAFLTGGADQGKSRNDNHNHYPFGGVSGGTVTIEPIAFLVNINGDVKLMHTTEETHLYEKLIDSIGPLILHIKELFSNKQEPKITKVEVIDNKS